MSNIENIEYQKYRKQDSAPHIKWSDPYINRPFKTGNGSKLSTGKEYIWTENICN